MVGLRRNKRYFYWCKRYIDPETNVTKFKKPIKLFLNYQPTNSDAQVLALGTEYSKYLRVTGSKNEISIISNKDRCYVNVKPPKDFNGMCEDADFEVSGDPLITLNEGEFILKKLQHLYNELDKIETKIKEIKNESR